ncbi:hypothetical protein [Streptomyces sp. SudanB25_2051]|uniref:hypothetical protein n=1 Tax=Streptomyces sp. SudanB25_2051 TaxID=3035275 RepID=UPI003F5465F4
MTVAQGVLAAVATAVVGVPFIAALAAWASGEWETDTEAPRDGRPDRLGADRRRVSLEKAGANAPGGRDGETASGCFVLLVVAAAIALVEVALAAPGPDDGCVWAVAALPALTAAAVPVLRHRKGARGLELAVHASGALTLAAGCLSVAGFVTGPAAHGPGPALLAATGAGAAATAVLALVRARVTLTVVPAAAAVLVAVFGLIASDVHDSAGYAVRYGHPVRMPLPSGCVSGETMACAVTWSDSRHGPSSVFEDGQRIVVHFSKEGRSHYARYYRLGGFYRPGDENDPNGVFLDTRAVGDEAYVTLGYEAGPFTPLGRLRLTGPMWAALPLLLLPLALHLYLVRERAEQPLRRYRRGEASPAPTA